MTPLLLTLLAADPVSIAAPGITCARIEKPVCDSFLDRFVTVLGASSRVRVITGNDISQLIGLERQKQLLGCEADGSTGCLAELAGSLGVDGVMTLSVVKSDPSYIITTRLVRSKDASIWLSATERADREGEVYDVLDKIAARFEPTLSAPAGATAAVTASSRSTPRWLTFTPAVVGVAAGVIGLAVFFSAGTERNQLSMHPAMSDVSGIAERGRTKEGAGVGLWVTAGVLVLASVVWLLVGSST